MSKKSNAFQRMILYIHQQLEPKGARVVESAMLLEQNIESPVEREVDVLIEKEIDGPVIRIALECRDRSAKDDIKWIDSLIGKYKHLPVNKVIAVSSKGFSKSAQLKANANQIETRTISEVKKTEWNDEFIKLGCGHLIFKFDIARVVLDLSPSLDGLVDTEEVVYCKAQTTTIKEFISIGIEESTKQVKEYIATHFFEIYSTRADLNKLLIREHRIPVNDVILIRNGIEHKINAVLFIITVGINIKELQVRTYHYLDAKVSKPVFDHSGLANIKSIYAAQIKGKQELHISRDKIKNT